MFTVQQQPYYQITYQDRRGGHVLTSPDLMAVHRALEKLSKRRIEADAFEVCGDERRPIGGSWKNEGRWVWSCEMP